MTKTVYGKVFGKINALDEDTGIADGEEVEVIVKPAERRRSCGDGIRRSAGVAADEPDFDEAFDQVARDRKAATFRGDQS